MWGSALTNLMLSCRKSKLSPEVKKYCVAQYMAIVGYHHSRMIHEYNEKFLPDSKEKENLLQYQDFLKKIREKRVQPVDFVDVRDETYPSSTESTSSMETETGELRKRSST